MSCCGGGRSRGSVSLPSTGGGSVASPGGRATMAVFRNDGDRPLLVIGRVTGAKYRFAPGGEVAVDIQDRSSVRQVPRLREMRLV